MLKVPGDDLLGRLNDLPPHLVGADETAGGRCIWTNGYLGMKAQQIYRFALSYLFVGQVGVEE